VEAQVAFFLNSLESKRLLGELDFLLRKVYGECDPKKISQVWSEVPNTLCFIQSLVTIAKEIKDVRWADKALEGR